MLITNESSQVLFTAFSASFNKGFKNAPTHAFEVAMKVASSTESQIYPWLGQFPQLREWTGDRQLKSVMLHDFFIKNKKYKSTVNVKRDQIEDDQYGVLGPVFENMGRVARLHPDQLVFGLLGDGFNVPCYDGQNFFSANHIGFDQFGNETVVSNIASSDGGAGGSGALWFLLDASQPMKPIVFQERKPYEFQSIISDTTERVFLRDEYLYGIRARVNVGFGLWQMAYASDAPLNAVNYATARAAMLMLRGDQGGILGVNPDTLVVPPSLESDARTLLKATSVAVGGVPETNIWLDSAKLIVSPFVL